MDFPPKPIARKPAEASSQASDFYNHCRSRVLTKINCLEVKGAVGHGFPGGRINAPMQRRYPQSDVVDGVPWRIVDTSPGIGRPAGELHDESDQLPVEPAIA